MSRKTSETRFEKIAKDAGFTVRRGRPIRITTPVQNKSGQVSKFVTTPDFYITDEEEFPYGVHVEVTDGPGETPHKRAQSRVFQAANVLNYVVITGDHISDLEAARNATELKNLLILMIQHALLQNT